MSHQSDQTQGDQTQGDQTQGDQTQGDQYDPDEDQDTEATMTAPPEGRPDGIDWENAGSDAAEVMVSQEDERPSDG